jgi:hypothetical protein
MSLSQLAKIVLAVVALGACEKMPGLSGPAPAAAPARPAAAAPPSSGTASGAAAAPPATAALPTEPRPKLEGMRQDEIVARLGTPVSERDVSPAKVLSYRASGCEMAIYLYFDTGRNAFFALHYDVNGRPAPSRDGDRCLRLIAAAKRG